MASALVAKDRGTQPAKFKSLGRQPLGTVSIGRRVSTYGSE